MVPTESQSTKHRFSILFIACGFENATANTNVSIAGVLANCRDLELTTKFWNLENDTSGSNVVRGKWQIDSDIKNYVSIKHNSIVVSFSTNINCR